jgi:multidrug resistance efflux pump
MEVKLKSNLARSDNTFLEETEAQLDNHVEEIHNLFPTIQSSQATAVQSNEQKANQLRQKYVRKNCAREGKPSTEADERTRSIFMESFGEGWI